MTRWLAALPLVAIAALAALFGFYALHHDPHVNPHALVGKLMPDVTLARLDDGSTLRLHDTLAKGPVVVNFFASWCGPCVEDQPALMSLKARGVRVVGVDYEDTPPRGSPQQAQAFLARLGDPFAEKVADPDGRAGIEFGVTGVPETYLVAADGKVLAKHTGPLTPADTEDLAARVLTGR
jgi:cytochrome c biogenesis protein CcmG/thiol:disulfide interchange protein DsbE